MNKTEIFPLYLVNPEQRVKWEYSELNHLFREELLTLELLVEMNNLTDDYDNRNGGIETAQLILKRMSKMSEKDKKTWFDEFGYSFMPEKFKAYFYLKEFMWLIKHGYALSDKYFEGDNPIAVEEEPL